MLFRSLVAVFVAAASFGVASAAVEELIVEKIHVPASCDVKSQNGDMLSMHYTGRLHADKTEFDSSVNRGPFQFQLGAGRVIKGWDEGLLDMCVGEKRKLIIPFSKAYGSRGMGPIPREADLEFDVELLENSSTKKRGNKNEEL